MKILGIETSCDETAAAVIEDGNYIHSNVIASQATMHAQYGGIVPEIASRQHMITIIPVLRQALCGTAKGRRSRIDLQRGSGERPSVHAARAQ